MCGLFGEFGPGAIKGPDEISAISRSIRHRGPDDDGIALGDGWMLGFRRLAILDLSPSGHQPMSSDDGRYRLVFNGEVYNYRELRRELEAEGEVFRSGTDTEVLLRQIVRRGIDALRQINGMYAFVFIDLQTRRYLLVRDRLGVKPLYLYATADGLRFASELKALLTWPDAPRVLDRAALGDYLATGYVAGNGSILQGYVKLPPGHYVEGSIDSPTIVAQKYWSVEINPGRAGSVRLEEAAEKLETLLADAVTIRLRSDVPVALLLSGGIDSAVVAAFAAASGNPPSALVAATGAAGSDTDETELARMTADHLGLSLEELPIGPDDLSDIDGIARDFDEPFADTSALAMMRICTLARRSATVLLSGDGGDEAFGGYRRYLETSRHGWLTAVPNAVRRTAWAFGRSLMPPKHAYRLAKATLPDDLIGAVFDGFGLARDPVVQAVLPADLAPQARDVSASVARIWGKGAAADLLSRQRAFDYGQYLPDDVLTKVDRASMAASTEVRSPFLDYRIVEFAAGLPNDLLTDRHQGKLILRHLAAKRLPPTVVRGRKRGFGVPVGAWMRTAEGATTLRERLLNRPNLDLWRPEGVRQVIEIHHSGKRDCGDLLWRLLILEAWSRQYVGPQRLDADKAA